VLLKLKARPRLEQGRIADVLQSMEEGFISLDRRWRCRYLNQKAAQIMGRKQNELLGKTILELFPGMPAGPFTGREGFRSDVIPIHFEVFHASLRSWLEVVGYPSATGFAVFLRDVTARKAAEEQARAAIQERQALLREIQHRVGNSLQLISSLLRLQAGLIKDQQARQAYAEGQKRVRSIALLHRALDQSNDLTQIDLAQYVRIITTELLRSCGGRVQVETAMEDARFGVETAVPCGLILYELVSNAFKHAFPENAQGKVWVKLDSHPDGSYCLMVRDNGVGLPPEIDIAAAGTLGFRLVHMLAEQLEARVEITRARGTAFQIRFSEPSYRSRV
jgi:PAS domain S-box-containing protein